MKGAANNLKNCLSFVSAVPGVIPSPEDPENERSAVPAHQSQTLLERIKRRRELNSAKALILPKQKSPYSALHTSGALPFWMKGEARTAIKSTEQGCIEVSHTGLRILQDTGHDLWLFMSSRGVEIRSFYNVPATLKADRISQVDLRGKPFKDRLTLLKSDHLGWNEILPESRLSGHERIRRAALIESLPDQSTAESNVRNTTPVTILQLNPSSIEIEISQVMIDVNLKEDRATEIKAASGSQCVMCGYRHLGLMAMTSEARRLTILSQSLTLRQRIALGIEKLRSGRATPTPYPISNTNKDI